MNEKFTNLRWDDQIVVISRVQSSPSKHNSRLVDLCLQSRRQASSGSRRLQLSRNFIGDVLPIAHQICFEYSLPLTSFLTCHFLRSNTSVIKLFFTNMP